MHVTSVSLEDFRSYERVMVELGPGVTTFIGPNGVGKTNLVEAIAYASGLSSHRVASDAPLVRFGADRAMIRLELMHDGRGVTLEVEVAPGRRSRGRINRGQVSRARDVIGVLTTVVFAPEDLALVKGEPSDRRRFVDELATLLRPRFAGVRADYERVLKQRNALLKSALSHRAAIDQTLRIWDEQLAHHGADIMLQRHQVIAQLVVPAAGAYAALAPGSQEFGCAMVSPAIPGDPGQMDHDSLVDALLAAMAARQREELARGMTLVGPQRDDLLISLGDHPAKGYASHGESWSCALALKIGSFHLMRDQDDRGDPVLILDDVFAELDASRRERLAQIVADAEQVLITAAVADDVPEALRGRHLSVVPGAVGPMSAT